MSNGGGGGAPSQKSPQETMNEFGESVTMNIPDWAMEIMPTVSSWISKQLSDRDLPFTISPKNLKTAINALGVEVIRSVAGIIKQPADLFYVPYKDYMEKMWQGIIDTGGKVVEKFGEYEGTLKSNLTSLAKGQGYAVSEMQSMFRNEVKSINSRFQNQLSTLNRLSISDPKMFRRSLMTNLVIAKGAAVQDARDKINSQQADMRLKSEFFGNEQLLELAKAATDVTFGAAKTRMAGLEGLQNLGTSEMKMKEANVNLEQQKLKDLLGVMEAGQNMFQQGWENELRAAEVGAGIGATGYNFGLGQYNADIGRYGGASAYQPTAGNGAAIGALSGAGVGALAGGILAAPTGGLSVLSGALLGMGIGGGAGALGGSLFG